MDNIKAEGSLNFSGKNVLKVLSQGLYNETNVSILRRALEGRDGSSNLFIMHVNIEV